MNFKQLLLSFFLIVLSFTFIKSQVANENIISKDDLYLRQMLANQPDYTAIEQTIFSEGIGGFSGESKVIKSGKRSVEIKADTIFIAVPGKPLVRVFPKDKTYALSKPEKSDSIFSPQKLAVNKNTIFKYLGTEIIGNYECEKIQVTFKNSKKAPTKEEGPKSIKFIFWTAKELKNLVVRSETILGDNVKFFNSLREISLSVNEEYFHIPKGFKKINYKIDD
jgi:hypothetical protein